MDTGGSLEGGVTPTSGPPCTLPRCCFKSRANLTDLSGVCGPSNGAGWGPSATRRCAASSFCFASANWGTKGEDTKPSLVSVRPPLPGHRGTDRPNMVRQQSKKQTRRRAGPGHAPLECVGCKGGQGGRKAPAEGRGQCRRGRSTAGRRGWAAATCSGLAGWKKVLADPKVVGGGSPLQAVCFLPPRGEGGSECT